MKLPHLCLHRPELAMLLAVTLSASSHADEARFFRITGPVPATITGFTADGYLTWTNVPTNATFTVQAAPSLLIQSNVLLSSNWCDYVQIPATNAATTHRIIDFHPPAGMVLIPAGSFTMGNCMGTNEGYSDEFPLHTVYVSAFYMDRTEVTKAQWDEVYHWATNHGYGFDNPGSYYSGALHSKGPTHPVHNINWYDCVKWCNARSEKEGRTPAYYTSVGQTTVYRTGQTNVQNDWVKWNTGYRLPTEADWEKAARGGASGHRFPWTDTDNIQHSRANYYSSSSYAYDTSSTRGCHPSFNDGIPPYTSPVGSFAPNGYGLYDMAGNVYASCWDWYLRTYYSSSPGSDPRGPASGSNRVVRGGSWFYIGDYCRTADRGGCAPASGDSFLGLRAVLPPGQP